MRSLAIECRCSLRGHYPTGSKGQRRDRWRYLSRLARQPPWFTDTDPSALGRADRPCQRLDEVLELRGRPALERLAVALVGGDHGVAVVPVEPRLGIEP